MTPFRWMVVGGCTYEIVALTTDRVPTVSRLVKLASRGHPLLRTVAWLWCGAWAWHFVAD